MPDPKKTFVKVKGKKEPKVETNPATRQDSIALKEDSLRLLKDYQDRGYKPTDKEFPDSDNEKSLKEIKERKGDTQIIRNGVRNAEKLKIEDYRTDIDENKYTQREAANGVLNMDVKPALYDKRIKPTSSIKLMSKEAGTYNDGVNVPYYGDMEISKEKKEVPEIKVSMKSETKKDETNVVKTPNPALTTAPAPKKVFVKKPRTSEYTETSQTVRDSTRVGTSFVKVDPKIAKKADEAVKELKK